METTIWQTYPQDEVLLFGISNTNNSNIIGNFVEENNLTYPILFDSGSPGGVQGGNVYNEYYDLSNPITLNSGVDYAVILLRKN